MKGRLQLLRCYSELRGRKVRQVVEESLKIKGHRHQNSKAIKDNRNRMGIPYSHTQNRPIGFGMTAFPLFSGRFLHHLFSGQEHSHASSALTAKNPR
ncbi:MAG: hypothetical protein GXO89_16970 [Chlorobi bacterium]|nr:hypothetical protein [Chlorobiota bacterium]